MGRSQETFGKKEREKKRLQKKKEKAAKKEERKAQDKKSSLDDMMAYVDEDGNISDTPPDPTKKKKIKAEDIDLNVPKREKIDLSATRKGKVDFFNDEKGYGFIRENETNEKYFFHISSTVEELVEGDKVTYELEKGEKGLNAVRLKKA